MTFDGLYNIHEIAEQKPIRTGNSIKIHNIIVLRAASHALGEEPSTDEERSREHDEKSIGSFNSGRTSGRTYKRSIF